MPTTKGPIYVGDNQVAGEPPETVPTWVRPAGWLPLPAVNVGEQKVVALAAIFDHDSNFVAFRAASLFTVDWGDGTPPENFGSNITASHKYEFSALDPSTTTTLGYRQAVMTVTPQAGQTLTTIDFAVKHTLAGLPTAMTTTWLDLKMAGASVTTLNVCSANISQRMLQRFEYVGPNLITDFASKFATYCTSLAELIFPDMSKGTTFQGMCTGCAALIRVDATDTRAGTNFINAFLDCKALCTVKMTNMSAGTSFNTMFQGCSSLREISLPTAGSKISGVLTMNYMFLNCTALRGVSLPHTSGATGMNNMFQGCSALQTVDIPQLTAATNLTSMFDGCLALRSISLPSTLGTNCNLATMFQTCESLVDVNLPNFGAGRTLDSMFAGCVSLKSVVMASGNAGSMGSMFLNCISLQEGPALDMGNVTFITSMFANCSSLRRIPTYDTRKVVTANTVFQNCVALEELPALDLGTVSAVSSFVSGCTRLARSAVTNFKVNHSYASCALGPVALNEIYTNLPVASAKTVTVTGNWGTTGDDPTIATAKGWTVAGS